MPLSVGDIQDLRDKVRLCRETNAYPVVQIKWVDTVLLHLGWQAAETYTDQHETLGSITHRTCGYLIRADYKGLVVALNVREDGPVCQAISISPEVVHEVLSFDSTELTKSRIAPDE